MTELFVDYSGGQLTGSAIAAATFGGQHFTGAIRYIDSPANLGGKHTTLAEYRSLVAAGLKVWMVFEIGTNDSAGGYASGVANATRAKAGCDYLGYKGVVFFCNDQTVLPSVSAWTSYLDGAASVLGAVRVGAYGFANAITAARGHDAATWQSGSQSSLVAGDNAWQWNNGSTTISGIPCDVNYIYNYYNPGVPGMATLDSDDLHSIYNSVWFGGSGYQLISDRFSGQGAWPETLVGSLQDRIVHGALTPLQAKIDAITADLATIAAPTAPAVDVAALAAAVAPLVVAQLSTGLAKAVADEIDRREKLRDNTVV